LAVGVLSKPDANTAGLTARNRCLDRLFLFICIGQYSPLISLQMGTKKVNGVCISYPVVSSLETGNGAVNGRYCGAQLG
jgi:hypothetical protein